MKSKIKKTIVFLNYYMGNRFTLTLNILLSILLFVYAYYIGTDFAIICAVPNFVDGVILLFKDPIFITVLFLIPMLANAINVVYRCEKLGANLLRFQEKKHYIDYLMDSCFKVNTIFFFILIFIIFVATFCFINSRFLILFVAEYKTLNILYFIFYLFKIYFIGQWISISSVLLMESGNKVILAVLNIIIYSTIIFHSTNQGDMVSSLLDMPILISEYLYMSSYRNFVLEIICFSMFAIFLLIIEKLLYIQCNKKMKDVGVI